MILSPGILKELAKSESLAAVASGEGREKKMIMCYLPLKQKKTANLERYAKIVKKIYIFKLF